MALVALDKISRSRQLRPGRGFVPAAPCPPVFCNDPVPPTSTRPYRLPLSGAITATGGGVLQGLTLVATATVVTPGPAPSGGIVAMFGIQPETWLEWDS